MDLATQTVTAFPDEPNMMDQRSVFRGRQFTQVIETLQQALTARQHLCCLVGAPGSGVSTLLDTLQRNNARDLICRFEATGAGQLVFDLLSALKIRIPGESETAARRRLCFALASGYNKDMPVLVLVDAAERLTIADLKLLLHLFSGSFAQIVLAGRPALLDRLQDDSVGRQPDCVCRLTPYDFDDTQAYVQHCLHAAGLPLDLLDADAIDTLFIYSGGTVRLIKRILDMALSRSGRNHKQTIDAVQIQRCVMGDIAGEFCSLADTPASALPSGATADQDPDIEDAESVALSAEPEPVPASVDEPVASASPVAPASPIASDADAIPVLNDIVLVTLRQKSPPAHAAEASAAAVASQPQPARLQVDTNVALIKPVWRDAALIAGVVFLAWLVQGSLTELSQHHQLFGKMVERIKMAWTAPAPLRNDSAPVQMQRQAPQLQSPALFSPSVDFAALHTLSSQESPPTVAEDAAMNDKTEVTAPPAPAAADADVAVENSAPTPKQEAVLSPEQLAEVARLYAGRAEYEIAQAEWKAAQQSVERGLAADPANVRLQQLQSHLRLMFGETVEQPADAQGQSQPQSAAPAQSPSQSTGPVQQLF